MDSGDAGEAMPYLRTNNGGRTRPYLLDIRVDIEPVEVKQNSDDTMRPYET
ncbi:hypothetical protein [Burkholderia glumae]|uniref:hypothetical protein n=1 Tax=Burkholderia glumae TaxID=337 RepID=UPI0021510C18|nr:hypothetical protein [Burkholderia glumae]